MTDIEKRFNNEMMNLYHTAKREIKYNAIRFLQLVADVGGLQAAKKLISKEDGTYGFGVLWEHGRLDLSVEALCPERGIQGSIYRAGENGLQGKA